MEEERKLRIQLRNQSKFHQTNEPWNVLKLNTSWVIGSLNYLFKLSGAKTWSEWQRFYYASGEKRLEELQKLSAEKQRILTNISLPYEKKRHIIQSLTREEEKINTLYGRTITDFEEIADFLYKELIKRNFKPHIGRDILLDYVKIRVIDETFIGFERERNAIDSLKERFPQLRFADVSYEDDVSYAIDTEIYCEEKLLGAVQVKSLSYMTTNNKFVHGVKRMNNSKNELYEQTFKVPVLYAFSDLKGTIHNHDLFDNIEEMVKKAS